MKNLDQTRYENRRKQALLDYVSRWFDACVERGSVDDYCPMGKLVIELGDPGHCSDPEARYKDLSISVTPTFPLEVL